MRRKKRVRVHTVDPAPRVEIPSFEGLLLGSWLQRRWTREVRLGSPSLLTAAGAAPQALTDAREIRIPADRVMFYEVVR